MVLAGKYYFYFDLNYFGDFDSSCLFRGRHGRHDHFRGPWQRLLLLVEFGLVLV